MQTPETGVSRWLLIAFLRRELTNRFSGTVLGFGWVLLQPLALLAVYGFIVGAVFKVKLPLATDVPYLQFVALALWPWLAFSEAVSRGMGAVVGNAALVKKVRLPSLWLVVAAVTASFVLNLVGYAVVLVLLVLAGNSLVLWGLGHVLLAWVGLWGLALGVAAMLAALQVFIRDVEQLVTYALALLFYLSPILFSVAMVPAWLAQWMWWNPITTFIEMIRAAWLGGAMPQWNALAVAWLAVAVLLTMGVWVFGRLAPHFEEEL